MRRAILIACAGLLLGALVPAPAPAAPRPDEGLPNLFAYPPSWLTGPVSGQMSSPDPNDVNPYVEDGCRMEERAAGARRCLRFATVLTNLDLGGLELALRIEPTGRNVYQVTRNADWVASYRPAGTFTVDPVTREVRLEDFYVMRLRRYDGTRAVGKPVASTGPRDLCPAYGLGYASHHDCVGFPRTGPAGPETMVGLPWLAHVWYTMDRIGQYIEISGVRDGRYVLEIEIDPGDRIAETYERDNETCVVLRLKGTEVDALRPDDCWAERT